MKRLVCLLACVSVCFVFTVSATEETDVYPIDVSLIATLAEVTPFAGKIEAASAILTEAETGTVLFAQNENEKLPIASVTKIMSTLLVMEALDSGKITLDDIVTVGEHAAEMGGSQIYLEPGEKISVRDLLKAMIVVSANDATVAFAEYIAGSEESFVAMMNAKAESLGMKNTHFANCHGLHDASHYSSALDVAVMTRELMKHKAIFDYTTIWTDTVRNGSFGLSNTNKLIRFYDGATGMKTGYTDVAKYCLSATAERNGTELIAVIIGADTSAIRFAEAKKLLDYGFANVVTVVPEKEEIGNVEVYKGTRGYVGADYTPPYILSEKGKGNGITSEITIDKLTAPIEKGDIIGSVDYFINGEKVASADITATEDEAKITFFDLFTRMLRASVTVT